MRVKHTIYCCKDEGKSRAGSYLSKAGLEQHEPGGGCTYNERAEGEKNRKRAPHFFDVVPRRLFVVHTVVLREYQGIFRTPTSTYQIYLCRRKSRNPKLADKYSVKNVLKMR